jgi:hypothetical protein
VGSQAYSSSYVWQQWAALLRRAADPGAKSSDFLLMFAHGRLDMCSGFVRINFDRIRSREIASSADKTGRRESLPAGVSTKRPTTTASWCPASIQCVVQFTIASFRRRTGSAKSAKISSLGQKSRSTIGCRVPHMRRRSGNSTGFEIASARASDHHGNHRVQNLSHGRATVVPAFVHRRLNHNHCSVGLK